jgi:membrane associated rhomboid family serine protease
MMEPADSPSKPTRVWLLGTPLVSLAMAVAIVVLWIPTIGMTDEEWIPLHYNFAVVPQRFFAEPGSLHAYPNILAQVFSLVTVSLLHADVMHAGLNALMCWQFGSPVAKTLGPGIMGASKWMLLFVVSVAAGSLAFLAIAGPNSAMVVGASGGTCGLIAADFLIAGDGKLRSPLSRHFLVLTLIFALINVLLVFVVPLVLPFYVSWEAHLGGYIAGAAMMLILGPKARTAEAA